MTILFEYMCGHIGVLLEKGFIRVAEVRDNPVLMAKTPCPDCKR